MADILNMKDDIVKVLFYINIIMLIIGIFVYSSKAYFISVILINLVFNGAFLVISKQSHIFQSNNRTFGKLGNVLDSVGKWGNKNG